MAAGPVSAALEAKVRTWVRSHGIVVWLDTHDHYTGFVDDLIARRKAGDLPYEVRAFRESYLELMLSLEGLASGTQRPMLLIHMPGFNRDTVRQTPIFEMYAAGTSKQKALDTLIAEAASGRVHPEEIAAFVADPDVTLARADTWLKAASVESRAGIGGQLAAMSPTAVLDDLLGGGYFAGRIADPAAAKALREKLAAWTGMSVDWAEKTLSDSRASAEDLAFAFASWALCVEYVDDLARPPISSLLSGARDLPTAVIEHCRSIAGHLRHAHEAFYQRTADEAEVWLGDEVKQARAEDLGKIDTFRFEEEKVLQAALAALDQGAWQTASEWATLRLDPKPGQGSFWVARELSRKAAWQLIAHAASLGLAMAAAGKRLDAQGSLEAAIERYVDRGAAVDNAHRRLEQRRVALLSPQLPEFETLRARLDHTRRLWRAWADGWARDFSSLCREGGFLPAPALQQRTIFDEVVRPMTQESGPTAYFVVDAWRFEMGHELYRQLAKTSATTARLSARLCELPSVTEVGMNVLAPVCTNGRLRPALPNADGGKILGFSTGEFRVNDPKTRQRAMHDRVGGATCPWLSLEDVLGRKGSSLRQTVAKAQLLVVHSQEIDNAGEKGVGTSVFDDAQNKLRRAWRLLRDAGVRRFVFTSDHGFLLLDDRDGMAQAHGRKIDAHRRHVFSSLAADHAGEVRVALADLGYEGVAGNVMFPESCAVFDTGDRRKNFAHGGNSLQERVIPVLTVVHRAAAGGSTLRYRISAKARKGIADMHRIEATVEVLAQHALAFSSAKTVEVALRVPDSEDVQVELCDIDGKAKIEGGVVEAMVGESFEVFFRITGMADARAPVELYHPSAVADVEPCVIDARFDVAATGALPKEDPLPAPATSVDKSWLEELPAGGVRQVFAHLAAHGTVTEQEASKMLGGARAARKFANQFDALKAKAPFAAKIAVVAGVKRYVREGSD